HSLSKINGIFSGGKITTFPSSQIAIESPNLRCIYKASAIALLIPLITFYDNNLES
ncbi:MAG: hypothetical protein F6K40_11520, partial [Okeania sp. SIO3I5]|nr:hypothetical protein [Okeania sp. SIO3I5]